MNEALLIVLKNFVETTLNLPFADVAALLTSETNEFKPDALDVLKELDAKRVDGIKASVNVEQTDIFRQRIENAKIEAKRKNEAEKIALQKEIQSLKEVQTADQIRLTERENTLKAQHENEKALLERKYNDFVGQIAKREKDLKIRNLLDLNLPVAKYRDVPQSAKRIILDKAAEKIGDVVEKDGKFSHFVDDNGNRLLNSHGHALTPEQVGHDVLSVMYLPMVQPATGGTGNVADGVSGLFKGW